MIQTLNIAIEQLVRAYNRIYHVARKKLYQRSKIDQFLEFIFFCKNSFCTITRAVFGDINIGNLSMKLSKLY